MTGVERCSAMYVLEQDMEVVTGGRAGLVSDRGPSDR